MTHRQYHEAPNDVSLPQNFSQSRAQDATYNLPAHCRTESKDVAGGL